MSPHRYRVTFYYKLSDDVVMKILEYLDPISLWQACKAFQRIYNLTVQYAPLRYNFQLALSGMKDGPVSHARAPPYLRLQLLLNYHSDWPRLEWTHENRLQIPTPALVGLSGCFIHQIRPHGAFNTLDLTQVPSSRLNVPPSQSRHLKYTTGAIENVVTDFAQSLVIMSHIFSQHGQVSVQLHFKELWTFEKHPRAHGVSYEVGTQVSARVTQVALSVYGFKMVMSLEFQGGRIRHLVVDWHTFISRWFDDQDVQLLDEHTLLTINKKNGTPIMSLCDIRYLAVPTTVRDYELPDHWKNCTIGFCPNTSAMNETSVPQNALFYASPGNRVVVVVAKSAASSRNQVFNWLFLREAYLKAARKERSTHVPFSQWAPYCLIKDTAELVPHLRGPYVVGTRVMYLEYESGRYPARLHIISFVPFPEASSTPGAWLWNGARAFLVPQETSRIIPKSISNGYRIEDMRLTEDNVVLFSEVKHGYRMATVLTFGARGRH